MTGAVARVADLRAPATRCGCSLPMRPASRSPDHRIDAVRGCVAVERGPLVLCLESTDLPSGLEVDDVVLADPEVREEDGLAHVALRRVEHDDRAWPYAEHAAGDTPTCRHAEASLVPYHSWAQPRSAHDAGVDPCRGEAPARAGSGASAWTSRRRSRCR